MTRQIKLGLFGLGAALSLLHMQGAVAETTSPASLDYVEIFKTKVFPCIHPTVKVDTVKVELSKAAATFWGYYHRPRPGVLPGSDQQEFYASRYHGSSVRLDSATQGRRSQRYISSSWFM